MSGGGGWSSFISIQESFHRSIVASETQILLVYASNLLSFVETLFFAVALHLHPGRVRIDVFYNATQAQSNLSCPAFTIEEAGNNVQP
jgi:hypothetical protein